MFFVCLLFRMQSLFFALFACAFILLIGYVGLLSFGHALYFGWASYLAAHSAKVWGFPPELAILTGTLTGAVLGVVAGPPPHPPPAHIHCTRPAAPAPAQSLLPLSNRINRSERT